MLTQRARGLRRVAAVLALCFVALAAPVTAAGEVPGERALLAAVAQHSGDRADGLAQLVDRATGNGPLALLAAVVVLALLRRGRARAGLAVAVSLVGVLGGNPLLKQLVDRPRPELLSSLDGVSPLSFPSGHAAGTAALAAAAVLAAPGGRRRTAVVVSTTVLVAVTAAAQLALARHHPSDVLAGWLWATAWTTAVWAQLGPPPPAAPCRPGETGPPGGTAGAV